MHISEIIEQQQFQRLKQEKTTVTGFQIGSSLSSKMHECRQVYISFSIFSRKPYKQ